MPIFNYNMYMCICVCVYIHYIYISIYLYIYLEGQFQQLPVSVSKMLLEHTQSHLFVYMLPIATFVLQQTNWIFVIEIVWPIKITILATHICIYVCGYVYVHVHVCVWMYTHVYICIYIALQKNTPPPDLDGRQDPHFTPSSTDLSARPLNHLLLA